jgi:hypothetical protein
VVYEMEKMQKLTGAKNDTKRGLPREIGRNTKGSARCHTQSGTTSKRLGIAGHDIQST